MASDALHAELAGLAGSELVARLRISTRRVDFEAAARVLDARDGRLAAAEAAVAEANKLLDARDHERTRLQEALAMVKALREKHDARGGPGSKDALDEPRSEDARPGDAIKAPAPEQRAEVAEEKRPDVIDLCSSGDEEEECRAGNSGVSRKRKASAPEVNGEGPRTRVPWKGNAAASAPSSDDEDDSLTLSQLMKKRGGAQPGADGEPKSTDSVRPLGGCLRTSLVIKEEIVEATVGGSHEPKEATFVQRRGDVESAEHGGMPRTMPRPPALSFALVNGTLKNPSRVNSAVPLGNHLPEAPVIRECPEARVVQSVEPKEPTFVEGVENGKSAEDVGVNRAMLSPTPPGFAARTGSHKIISNGDHVEVTIAGKEGSLGNDILKTPSVIMERPEARVGGSEEPKVAAVVQGRVKIKSEDDEGVSMTMLSPTPPGFAARTGSHKNLSKADHGVQRIASKIVESARADAELPKGHTVSALGDSMVLGLEANRNVMPVEGLLPSAVTRNWECDADVFISCLENKELCMQAACALYRQKKLTFQPAEGGQSGNTGFSKHDAHRVAKLMEFLLDGKVYGPLKRTTEELMKHDSTGPSFLEEVVCQFHDQLFDIYKNKEDPYFR